MGWRPAYEYMIENLSIPVCKSFNASEFSAKDIGNTSTNKIKPHAAYTAVSVSHILS